MTVNNAWDQIKNLVWNVFNRPTIADVLDIFIVAYLIYKLLMLTKETRASAVLKGLVMLIAASWISDLLGLTALSWVLQNVVANGAVVLVILFKPEMRKALENLGRKNVLAFLFSFDSSKEDTGKFSDKTINEMVKACYEMGKVKTGALIVVEDEIVLSEYERTGIAVDGILTSQLLINIFEKNTPLHDGAVIVRGDRVVAATCYLPLTDSLSISKDLGTRHRAAVGISEVSDSLTIVVSEETGRVSIALGGELYRNVDAEFLKNKLTYIQRRERELSKIALWKRRLKDAKTARKNDNK